MEASILYPKKDEKSDFFSEKIWKISVLEHISTQIEVWRAKSCPEHMVFKFLEQV